MKIGLAVVLLALVGLPASATELWKCTQPNALNGKPLTLRYQLDGDMLVDLGEIGEDDIRIPFKIVANDQRSIIATWTITGSRGGPVSARTIVIDRVTGRMAIDNVEPNSTATAKLPIFGVCNFVPGR